MTLVMAVALVLVAATGVGAANTVSYDTIGTGATATQIGSDIELYTPAGLTGSGYVRLNIDGGIALNTITSLSYTAKVITPGAGGFAPEVVLNIDADGASGLEGTGIDWMLLSYNPATLSGDNFLSGDNWPASVGSPDSTFVNRDALSGYNYWSANDTRTGFGSLWTPFTTIVPGMLPVHGIDATDMVYSIDFVVGTSGNFDGMKALFSSVELNGTIYPVVPPDTQAPLVAIEEPGEGDCISGTVDIYGTIFEDKELSHYNIAVYPGDADFMDFSKRLEQMTVYRSTGFDDELIYQWDTTGYADGEYLIRLAARDKAGNRDLTGDPYLGGDDSQHVIKVIVANNKAGVLFCSGVPGKGILTAPGLQKSFNPKSKAAEHAGKKK